MEDKVYENAGTTIAPDGKRYTNDDANRPTQVPAPRGKFLTSSAFDEDPRTMAVDDLRAAMTRTVDDAVIVIGDETLESTDANFTAADVGAKVTGAGLPDGTTIESVTDENTVELSVEPTVGGRRVTDAGTTNADATVTSVSADFTDDDIDATVVASAGFAAEVTIDSINSESSVEMSTTSNATGTNRTLVIIPAGTDREITIERDLATYIDAADAALDGRVETLENA